MSSSTNNNSNSPNVVPVFNRSNFRIWAEKMEDYLKSQKLWHYVKANGMVRLTPAILSTAMPNEIKVMDDWDKVNNQANGIIALRLAHSLRTHLKPTVAATWSSLDTTFGVPGLSTVFADFHAAMNVWISGTQNYR